MKYLTTGEVAEACQVSVGAVKKWIRQGKLKAFRSPGGHHRIRRTHFEAFCNAYGFTEAPPDPPEILVVDDEPEMAQFVVDALRRADPALKLESASSGYEGLLKVGLLRPHLLILDIRMPGTDGLEVCRRIKGNPATRATKILAITAYLENSAEESALESGADAFLAKPFTIQQLRARVKRLIPRP